MTHFHIRWTGAALEWDRFGTSEQAEASARKLARPGDTFTIEEHDENTCPLCWRLMERFAIRNEASA